MIDTSRWIVNEAGASVRISLTPANDKANVPRMSHHTNYDGRWAIYECSHCGIKRVWGTGNPEEPANIVLLQCQNTLQSEQHHFVGMSTAREGRPWPMGHYPMGQLPCKGSRRCACK